MCSPGSSDGRTWGPLLIRVARAPRGAGAGTHPLVARHLKIPRFVNDEEESTVQTLARPQSEHNEPRGERRMRVGCPSSPCEGLGCRPFLRHGAHCPLPQRNCCSGHMRLPSPVSRWRDIQTHRPGVPPHLPHGGRSGLLSPEGRAFPR